MVQEAVFQAFAIFTSLAVTQGPAVGRVEEENVDCADADFAVQGIAVQQVPHLPFGRCRPFAVVLDAVGDSKGETLRQPRQRVAASATGVEDFQRYFRRSQQAVETAQGGLIGGVIALRRVVVCDARVHQTAHRAPPSSAGSHSCCLVSRA